MSTAAELSDELLEVLLDSYPVGATLLGIRGRDDRLTDYSEAGEDALRARASAIAVRAKELSIGTGEATHPGAAQDEVTRAVIIQQAEAIIDRLDARGVEYSVTDYATAAAADLLLMMPMIGITEQAHADAYLARLAEIPQMLATVTDRHRTGIAAGRLPVRHLAQAATAHLDRYLADDDDPFRRPQPAAGATVDGRAFAEDRDRLLDEVVRPAFARYRDAVATEFEPHGRPTERPGVCWLPDGESIYAQLIRFHTTTDRSPQDLHRTGLDIIERLKEEYAHAGAEAFGTGDVTEIFERLRTDPALRWTDGEEMLAAARAAIGRAEIEAPKWFGRLPDHRCTVQAVPEADAPGAPGAYYMEPAMDGSRPGVYFANTYRAEERFRSVCEATAFHEGVPGHHFQLTIAQGLTDLPLLRRLAQVNAYIEGWALYTERLADEMGLYSDAIARMGMLNEDSMRAARLVVDTGLHAMGWSRERVVDYLRDNTAMPQVEIDSETDRYISDPGQALGYMVGRVEIQRMRGEAERALGDRFDIKAFHDTVLGNGPLPLGVLDAVTRDWAAKRALSHP